MGWHRVTVQDLRRQMDCTAAHRVVVPERSPAFPKAGPDLGEIFDDFVTCSSVSLFFLVKHIWERFHTIAQRSNALSIRGRLASRQGVIHAVVQHLQDMHHELSNVVPPVIIYGPQIGYWRCEERPAVILLPGDRIIRPTVEGLTQDLATLDHLRI